MSFWRRACHRGTALVEDRASVALSYEDLHREVHALCDQLGHRQRKRLGLVLCDNTTGPLLAYLAALNMEDAVCLISAEVATPVLSRLLAAYEPDWIVSRSDQSLPEPSSDYEREEGRYETTVFKRRHSSESAIIHPELGVLLSTSGTTGCAKMVRLSYGAVEANAAAIADYLGLSSQEQPILALPMHYSYGLSVINSHLSVGATIVLSSLPVTGRAFWELASSRSVTSMAGVPYTYEMLLRIGWRTLAPDSLKTLTVAGGRLRPDLVPHFGETMQGRAGRFFVMYGQTEATARISYVPPDRVGEKLGSIGVPIPGGSLDISSIGELIYSGPNVMLGYADTRTDLAHGDCLHGVLATGDLGTRDAEGYYYITGRSKRIAKVLGLRVSLDDVEALLASALSCSAACAANDSKLSIVVEDESQIGRARDVVVSTYRLHPSVVSVRFTPALPRTPHGKMDYRALEAMVDQ